MKKKQSIIITLVALILLAGVAYIAGSINSSKDKAGASNANKLVTNSEYKMIQISSEKIQFEIPKTYTFCNESYIWRLDDCSNTQDAPDMQIHIYEITDNNPERMIQEKNVEFFGKQSSMVVTSENIQGKQIFTSEYQGGSAIVKATVTQNRLIYLFAWHTEQNEDKKQIEHMILTVELFE